MKKLTSNLTSAYLDAANKLQKKTKKKIVAYVEAYDDIFFWRSVLSEFETDERMFEVMLPSRTNLNRGKKVAMMNELGENLGQCMIACVDADVDYLLQRHSVNSVRMLDNPYVVHTYAYSIENLQCYAPSLHQVCVMSTLNDRQVFDFERYLTEYSRIIYDLFVWAIWLYREGRFTEFPLNTLNNFITIEKLNIHNVAANFEKLRHICNRKLAWMQKHYPEAKGKLKPLKEELATLGVTPDNTYLYIQGHHLMDNVVAQAMTPVITILRRERENEIKRLGSGNRVQMDNEMACYQHSICCPEQMLRRNTNFKAAEPYQRLRQHLEQLMERLSE